MTITVTSTSMPDPSTAEQAPAALAKGTVGEEDKSATADKADPKAPAKSDPATEEDKEENDKTDETDEDDAEEAAKSGDEGKPKKKGGFQKRIEKLNARATAAQEERDYWKAQALKGAKADPAADQNDQPKAAAPAGEPDPDKFETHAEYVKAVVKWDREQADKAKSEDDAKANLAAEQKKQETAHRERVKAFVQEHADYDEVLENLRELNIAPSPTLDHLLLTSENGPKLIYELAKNPDEFKRISALGPIAAAREFGRLEAKLTPASSEAEKQKPKLKTDAPAPIAPVGSKGVSVEKSIYDANLSQAEYERLRAKQREAARKSG